MKETVFNETKQKDVSPGFTSGEACQDWLKHGDPLLQHFFEVRIHVHVVTLSISIHNRFLN